jgi:hypothetical protein
MNNEEMFQTWAPDASPWSRWAKPILFATMPAHIDSTAGTGAQPPAADWNLPPSHDTALILDLPSEASIHAAIALSQKGWQPVPLFNGCHNSNIGFQARPIIDTAPLSQALALATPTLRQCSIPPDAPPAFLLDSMRLSGANQVMPGRFDNRWCVVPQDMPSANHLVTRGIRRIIVCAPKIMDDLAHSLRRYQEARITLQVMPDPLATPVALDVPRPRFFRSLWHRFLVTTGLHRNAAGGFGSYIPIPSSSGHG